MAQLPITPVDVLLARRSVRPGERQSLLVFLLLLGVGARTVPAQSPGGAAPAPAVDPSRFEPEIRAFEAADSANPPPLGGVVFVGSSSVKNWTDVAADFPGVPVLNRGFGGSTMGDVVYYADRAVLRYRPRLIVLYAGDNDLAMGRKPDQITTDYQAFLGRVRAVLPATRIVYVSIKPSPSRRALMDQARDANARIRSEIARDSLQTYVDVFTPMLNAEGEPRPELFLADSLHMNRKGYDLWRGMLASVIRTDSLALRMPTLLRITDSAAAARPASHVSAAKKVDRPVRVRYCPEPVYPPALAQYGFAGEVVLVFVVDTSGRPEMDDLVVSEASNPGFIPSARKIIAKCRFDPAMKSGRPVRLLVQQLIRFVPGPRPE